MANRENKMANDSIPLQASQNNLWKRVREYRYLYLLLLPLIAFYLIFSYVPMYGITLAFKTFDYSKGIIGSPWNGFQNFREVFADVDFLNAFRNTVVISLGRLLIEFPVPIVLALLLNEISKSRLKRVYQTILTFPHFLSWVVLSGIIISIFSDQGTANQILGVLGMEKNQVLAQNGSFVALLFISNIWKEAGWSTILYLASIAGINPELYEAAVIDGANRFQQMKAITWPTVKSTALILLILAVGNVMNGGFDQIFNMYNPGVYERADIIDTFVYRSAFTDSSGFGFTTTVGLMKSVVNFILLYGTNAIVKAMGGEGGI
jgi:putative aldouronate transport system permease protein